MEHYGTSICRLSLVKFFRIPYSMCAHINDYYFIISKRIGAEAKRIKAYRLSF